MAPVRVARALRPQGPRLRGVPLRPPAPAPHRAALRARPRARRHPHAARGRRRAGDAVVRSGEAARWVCPVYRPTLPPLSPSPPFSLAQFWLRSVTDMGIRGRAARAARRPVRGARPKELGAQVHGAAAAAASGTGRVGAGGHGGRAAVRGAGTGGGDRTKQCTICEWRPKIWVRDEKKLPGLPNQRIDSKSIDLRWLTRLRERNCSRLCHEEPKR